MNPLKRHIPAVMLTALVAVAQTSCIDDSLSDCDSGYQIDYELRLVTNITTELQTQLTTQTDLRVAEELHSSLSGVFTDYAHDVDLAFYDTGGDSARLFHDEHIMDANQASYTLNLPMRQYMHLATANIIDNPQVELVDDESCHTARLVQAGSVPGASGAGSASARRDTVASHTTGVFTARLPMEVLEGIDQNFDVHLYMANCAASLVVDTTGSGISDLRVFTTGFATAFSIADSTYLFDASPIVRADEVATGIEGSRCFCSVTFPSRESTRSIIETTDPFVTDDGTEGLWQLRAYATTPAGSVTESILNVTAPLRAGQLRVIKARIAANGSVSTDDHTVAVSVSLDWSPGGRYEPEL